MGLRSTRDHDNTGGHIVQNGRQEKREERDAPQQRPLALRGNHLSHEVEAAVLVYDFHNGHRTHREEERLGSVAQMHLEVSPPDLRFYQRGPQTEDTQTRRNRGVEHVQHPADNAHIHKATAALFTS